MARWVGFGLIAIIVFFYLAGSLDLLDDLAGTTPRTADSQNHHTLLALVIIGVGALWFFSKKNRGGT